MSNLIRWEPMREMVTLRDAMDSSSMRPSPGPGVWRMAAAVVAPAVDMYQTDDEVVVKAALPGHEGRRR